MVDSRTDLDKILGKDQLARDFDEVLEKNPETIVISYVHGGVTSTIWYGQWATARGLVEMIKADLNQWLSKEGSDK